MTARRDRSLFVVCMAAQGCIIVMLSLWARWGCAPSTVVLGLGAAFVPYAGAVLWSPAVGDRRTVDRIAIVASLAFGAAFLLAPPVMSDDLYRYLWEGRVWLEGLNPYRLAPNDPALASLRTDLWTSINNKDLASIYPPLSQLLFVAAAWLGGRVWMIKVLALGAHVASVVVVSRIARQPRAALALGLNPLLLSEAALNGHFDVLTGLTLLLTAWALTRHRIVAAAVAACTAVGLKAVGVVLLPLFARRPKAFAAVSIVSAWLLLPLVWSRSPFDAASGPGQFATRWRGNESVFAVVQWLADRLFAEDVAALVARAAVAAAVLVVWIVVLRRRLPPLEASRSAVWAVLLVSPQVHPWYLAWLLPLEVFAGGRAGLVWSAAALCAYAPLDRWVRDGVWEMPVWLQLLSYAAVLIALILDPHRPSLHGR
ncbi:MAG: glycosyltransferase 87 family protein [Polyangiales bacterium]